MGEGGGREGGGRKGEREGGRKEGIKKGDRDGVYLVSQRGSKYSPVNITNAPAGPAVPRRDRVPYGGTASEPEWTKEPSITNNQWFS